MIPRIPYLQNAVRGFHELTHSTLQRHNDYVQWMRDQGVIMPLVMTGDIDSIMLEFTDQKSELMFILRWS